MACAFYCFRAIQRGIKDNPYHTGCMNRLIWVFTGHTCPVVGFVVCWLICFLLVAKTLAIFCVWIDWSSGVFVGLHIYSQTCLKGHLY